MRKHLEANRKDKVGRRLQQPATCLCDAPFTELATGRWRYEGIGKAGQPLGTGDVRPATLDPDGTRVLPPPPAGRQVPPDSGGEPHPPPGALLQEVEEAAAQLEVSAGAPRVPLLESGFWSLAADC